ncbi:protein DENND6A isoform X2 [Belonocnema kinseyi]|uniref:protein DENND6A isoform X2 n=1 Tax=Belonocnema kinseyi TaxID=2817044 RepID=UPI00143D5767|nr:protein DENND6A isoform X2 [Belonocnema kinseyi]
MSSPSSLNKGEQSSAIDDGNSRKKWEYLKNWIHCICVVAFDLELGQAIEAIYPSHIKLAEQERSNVCYLAFPDSNSGCMGDTQYHVRIRQSGKNSQENTALKNYNKNAPIFLRSDTYHYWGYVYFRQVKDKTLPRGYFQKSIILISKLPFVNLFTEIVALIAPKFFETGKSVMESIVDEIADWPAPVPGEIINLPLMGVLFQTYVPNQYYKLTVSDVVTGNQTTREESDRLLMLTSVYEDNIFQSLAVVVSHIHLLWELVLLAEPIVVMASSPTMCSRMVQALTALITPLKYHADHRPYFTIHDSEFKEYATDTQNPPAVILGVTNPFFAKTLQHWPHIVRINGTEYNENFKHRIKKSDTLKILDSKPGVYTEYKPFLRKDKAILKKLHRGIQTKRPGEAQTVLLRKHLMELTESFMIPLERYIATLMPLQKNISPFKATPIPHLFNMDEFLATLSSSGPQLTSGVKGDWVGLYRRFFRSPNFSGWFQTRYAELSKKIEAIHLEALSQAVREN